MKNIVILISGRGSNMEAIVRTAQSEKWPARIAAVISNRADAAGLEFASSMGIPTAVVPSKGYASREAFDAVLQEKIDQYEADLVVLAGFMRILTAPFVEHYSGRMINIHPSLLPSFRGLHTHQQAIDAGVKVHGATVHFVTPDLDVGPIIAQAVVPVLREDTEDTLAARVLRQEHVIYSRAIQWIAEGKVTIENNKALIDPSVDASQQFFFSKEYQ